MTKQIATRTTFGGVPRCFAVALFALFELCSVGCASRGNIELLESQLRRQEDLLRSYQDQLAAAQQELTLARREMDQLRAELARTKEADVREERTRALAAAAGLTIHSLLTGGQDRDGRPGDDVIHAVLYPSDQQGEAVKLSGELELEAFDLEEEPRLLGRWRFSPEESRELWHSGFLASGYEVELPWQTPPRGSQILLKAKMQTPDGRTFDATEVVAVDPGRGITAERPVPPPYDGPATSRLKAGAVPATRSDMAGDTERLPRPLPPVSDGSVPPGPMEGESTILKPVARGTSAPSGGSVPVRTSDNWTDATLPQIR